MFTTITELFLGKPFEFYSPYLLDETYQRLQDVSERDKRKPSIWRKKRYYLLITFDSVTSKSYRFCADRDAGRNLIIIAKGLVSEDYDGIKVTGAVSIGKFTLGFMLFWLIMWLGITGSFGFASNLQFFPFFGVLVVGMLLIVCKQYQNKMYNQIQEILGKSKKKNVESLS